MTHEFTRFEVKGISKGNSDTAIFPLFCSGFLIMQTMLFLNHLGYEMAFTVEKALNLFVKCGATSYKQLQK